MIESSLRMWEDHKIAGIGLNRWKDNYYGEYRPEKAVEENTDIIITRKNNKSSAVLISLEKYNQLTKGVDNKDKK